MMNKSRECEEIVTETDSGKSYRLAGNFGFIRMLAMAGRDPSFIFEDLANGLLPPEEIKNVLKFAIVQVDGEDIKDEDREAQAVTLVEAAGLQDCSLLARMMMSHAMVGAIKKKQIAQNETIQGAIISPNHSRWKTFSLLGLLLGAPLILSTIAICIAIR